MNSRRCIENPRNEHQSAPNFSTVEFMVRKSCGDGIVGSIQQHNMNKCQPNKERDEASERDPIFLEQLLAPNIPPTNPEQYNHTCKTCAPPADK